MVAIAEEQALMYHYRSKIWKYQTTFGYLLCSNHCGGAVLEIPLPHRNCQLRYLYVVAIVEEQASEYQGISPFSANLHLIKYRYCVTKEK
jgi:hypothetical protein